VHVLCFLVPSAKVLGRSLFDPNIIAARSWGPAESFWVAADVQLTRQLCWSSPFDQLLQASFATETPCDVCSNSLGNVLRSLGSFGVRLGCKVHVFGKYQKHSFWCSSRSSQHHKLSQSLNKHALGIVQKPSHHGLRDYNSVPPPVIQLQLLAMRHHDT
jgi:hypothetical protein